ncbi:nucleotidyltransferase family protein [Ideonella sp.]|uniref:nucleotidyltransferase family protein n=1 Tax=Ideonella sp. TaxID=1929293 RepID=UPI002B47C508|nr:nucleotidyltransferase family protein [Ideonella sp.]HJV70779.1 nucleotidyltransferase family protein [Ideonella sp.]
MKTPPTIIVLGAGRGSRYTGARHKLAEPLGSDSVLKLTVSNALASGLPVVVITTTHFADDVADLVAKRDIVVLDQGSGVAPGGMGDSIAAGVAARPAAGGWLVMPADMPLVRPATMVAVANGLGPHPVAYAQHLGRRGHPVAFGAELFSELVRLSGDEGARRVLARYPGLAVEVDDPGVLLDMDTEADLASMRARVAAQLPVRP